MNSTKNTVKGFFVALGDESKTFQQGNMVIPSRSGVFQEKEHLVKTISTNAVLRKKEMHVIEVEVSENDACKQINNKFGIRGGSNIKIVNVQSFKQVEKEILAVVI